VLLVFPTTTGVPPLEFHTYTNQRDALLVAAGGGYTTVLRALPPLALVALLLLALDRSPLSAPGQRHPG
jgi:hypothetical protein